MPKQTTDKDTARCNPENCYASRHLDGPDYKVWDVMKAHAPVGDPAKGIGLKEFPGQRVFVLPMARLANAVNLTVNAVDNALARLVAAGWIIGMGLRRRSDGSMMWRAERYQVLDHEDWVKTHADQCPDLKYDEDGKPFKKAARPPRNFFPVLNTALDKIEHHAPSNFITGERDGKTSIHRITDEEDAALTAHWAKPATSPLVMESATSPLGTDQAPATSALDVAATSPLVMGGHQWTGDGPHPVDWGGICTQDITTKEITTHTPTPPDNGVSVCVEISKPSAKEAAEKEVGELLKAFPKYNGGQPGQITPKQRTALVELCERHTVEKFRPAAKAWLTASPWDNRTTHPFVSLIGGFENYLGVKLHADNVAAQAQQSKINAERATVFYDRQHAALWGSFVNECDADEFMLTLTEEDRTYIQKVRAAEYHSELPPDNGRNYTQEMYAWRKAKDEATPAFNLETDPW